MLARAVLATLLVAGLLSGAAAQDFPCAAGGFMPINDGTRKISPEVAILMLLIPIGGLYRDGLADKPKVSVRFRIVDAAGKPVPSARIAALHQDSGRFVGLAKGSPATLTLPVGDYDFNALVPEQPIRWGTRHVSVDKDHPQTVEIRLDQASPVGKPGAFPAKVVGGEEFVVGWNGPRPPGATFTITKPSGDSREIVSQTNVGAASGDFTATAPVAAGSYDAILAVCAPEYVLARWTLAVSKPKVSIEAPTRVTAGQEIPVKIDRAALEQELLRIETAAGEPVDGARNGVRTEDGTFAINAPLVAGEYRLAYSVDATQLAVRPLTVTAATFAIKAPETAQVGVVFPVEVAGARPEDVQVQIWSKSKPAVKVAENLPVDEVRIVAAPGAYEIQLTDKGFFKQATLARTGITLQDGSFIRDAPAAVGKTEDIQVDLVAPMPFADSLNLVPRGSRRIDQSEGGLPIIHGTTVTLSAPDKPGAYDLVYVARVQVGSGDKVLARRPIDVR